MPELIMLCGIPTSGKTTWIKNQKQTIDFLNDHKVISTDNIIEDYANINNTSYNDIFGDFIETASSIMEDELVMSIENKKSIIWDQTNLTKKTRARKLNKIPKEYKKIAVWFNISLDEALIRNQNRPGKVIPENILKKMHFQFTIPKISEGFDSIIKGN